MYKTQKLWNSMNKIPNRTLRQAFSSITAGISPKVITALKDLYHSVVIRKQQHFNRWKDVVEDLKKRGTLDELRA